MASFEPVQAGEHTWYIPAGVNLGLWEGPDGVTLIDSGNDKESGRQVRKMLDDRGWALRRIVNTHSNADHIGGNAYLQSQTGCAVAATLPEAALIAEPVLEPSFLWGAFPFRELRGKQLEARPSPVGPPIQAPGVIDGTPLQTVPLPGHFFGMIGVLTPDRVFFAADSLFGEEILEKYRVVFLYDVARHLETLDRVEAMQAELFVPSHAAPVRDVRPLAAVNRAAVRMTAYAVAAICARPRTSDEVLAELCGSWGIELDFHQYVLVGNTVKAYLTYLRELGRVRPRIESNRLLWSAAV